MQQDDRKIAEDAQNTSEEAVVVNTPRTPGQKARDIIKKLAKRWFIDAFTGMAQGLFVTLIAGTIVKTIGGLFGDNAFGNMLVMLGNIASVLMGAGIGAGIASHLGAKKLVVFASLCAGFVGAYSSQFLGESFTGGSLDAIAALIVKGSPGNPIGAYVTSLAAAELGMLVSGKTKLDILLVPLTCLLTSFAFAYVAYPFIWLIDMLGKGIAAATAITPFFMGIIVAAAMGILLTMPTSSAAIWVSVSSTILASGTAEQQTAMYIAGGAAVVGCAAHMVGFAVMSFKENGVGGLISQGLGTSMLQIPNIMRNPWLLVPPTVASVVVGPIATCAFKLRCGASGGGMGTCGFVGIIDAFEASVSQGHMKWWLFVICVIVLFFVLPALISWGVCELLRKTGKIKFGDLKLNYDN